MHHEVSSLRNVSRQLSCLRSRFVKSANRPMDVQSRPIVSFPNLSPKEEKRRLKILEQYQRRLANRDQDQGQAGIKHLLFVKPYLPEQVPVEDSPTPRPEKRLNNATSSPRPTRDQDRVRTPTYPLFKRPWSSPINPIAAFPPPQNLANPIRYRGLEKQWAHSRRPTGLGPFKPKEVQTSAKTVFYRAVEITRLDPSCTLTDIMGAIAAAGPFGMVTSASLIGGSLPRATIIFNSETAAQQLVAHIKMNGLRLGAFQTPVTAHVTGKGYPDEPADPRYSRVLRLAGNPTVEGFDEASIRRILEEKFNFPSGDSRWLDSEPPRTSWFHDGNKAIDWAFFSNEYQTRRFQAVLKQHFGNSLFVGFGVDPCGDFKITGNLGRKDVVNEDEPDFRSVLRRK